MRKYSRLLLPALIVGGVLFTPANVAEAKVEYNEKEYDTLQEAIDVAGANEATFTFTKDEASDAKIPVGANYTINGGDRTLTGTITVDAGEGRDDVADKETHLSINSLHMDGNSTKGWAIGSQNQKTTPNDLYLTVADSSISNYKNKGIYLTNAKELIVDNVKFNDNATTEQTNINGDYAFDLNLIGVQDVKISITNSTFAGHSGGNSPIKVTQRGYADDIMTDIPYYYNTEGTGDDKKATTPTGNPAASIASLTIENCDFSAVTGNSKGDVALGSSPNDKGAGEKAGTARLGNSNFPVEVKAGDTPIDIYVRGSADQEAAGTNAQFTVEAGRTGVMIPAGGETFTADEKEFALEVGKTHKLAVYLQTATGKVELADVLNPEKLTFASDNDKVATVSEDGTVAAVAEGTAKVTATYGDQTVAWNVTVKNDMAVTDPEGGDDATDAADPTDEEEVANPQTYDGSMMFVIAGIISALGLAGAGIGLGKESE